MSLPETANGEFYISEELILVRNQAQTRDEILHALADKLQQKNLVKDSFGEALKQREEIFPTGLSTPVTGVAIPHTDSIHVKHPALAVATMAKPVRFRAMDNPDKEVDVEIVIMLAVKEPKMQLSMLKKVMQILQDCAVLTDLRQAATAIQIKEILSRYLESYWR